MTQIIIGIDGGGTKTIARAMSFDQQASISTFDETLKHASLVAEQSVGPCALTNDIHQSKTNIASVIQRLSEQGGFALDHTIIVAGLSGAENGVLNGQIRTYLTERFAFKHENVIITSDAKISAIGAGGNQPVICLALGTGSVATAIDGKGDFTYIGGWGFSIGDEGGAAYLGKLAVRQALWEMDVLRIGRYTDQSALATQVKQVIGENKQQVLSWLSQAKAYEYGQIAPIVTSLKSKCPSADAVFQEHVKEVEKLINCISTSDDTDLVLTGSLAALTVSCLSPRIGEKVKDAKGSALDGACYMAIEHFNQRDATDETASKSRQTRSDIDANIEDNVLQQSSGLVNQLDSLQSESRNPNSMDIDLMPTETVLKVINREDAKVPSAVEAALPQIGNAVDTVVNAFEKGGRLIYLGAGTSGRLGILDAVECPPTFSVDYDKVVALIAGGDKAVYKAVEGAEDDPMLAKQDLLNIDFNFNDVLVGIAASGRTPYVLGGLDFAKAIGAATVSITCNPDSPLMQRADIPICAEVGPEVLTGSTRLKSGTAQKLILNMLTTASMIQIGKCYENLMVDVNASNKKLVARAIRIVMQATRCSENQAKQALDEADYQVKVAILMIKANISTQDAIDMLQQHNGKLRIALQAYST